jgi:hypothetical protein
MIEMGQTRVSAVKQYCANVYGSAAAKYLLGDSFHPGVLPAWGAAQQCGHCDTRHRRLFNIFASIAFVRCDAPPLPPAQRARVHLCVRNHCPHDDADLVVASRQLFLSHMGCRLRQQANILNP